MKTLCYVKNELLQGGLYVWMVAGKWTGVTGPGKQGGVVGLNNLGRGENY